MKTLRIPLLSDLDQSLKAAADPVHRASIQKHFGSNVDDFYGVRMQVIRECAASTLAGKAIPLATRWKWCDELLSTDIFEHKIAAFFWAWQVRRQWDGSELPRFARWLHESVDEWMETDDLCIRVIGDYFLRFPEQAVAVKKWSRLPGKWSRRGSAVSLVPLARSGQAWSLIESVADRLKNNPEPLVAKACGWLLKVASGKKPAAVRAFVTAAGSTMAPIVRRTALEKRMQSH
ncbi:MAG: DNA alkylation repair protein [Candidatus Methylacidiphilales bacterium]